MERNPPYFEEFFLSPLPPKGVGAVYGEGGGCRFCVWAPFHESVAVHLLSPRERVVPLIRCEDGYHLADIGGIEPGARYRYRLSDGRELPDPASRFQPEGVFGPSAVVSPSFAWNDADWRGIPLEEYIFYEMHVGTFTRRGTFEAAISRLDDLADLGVKAVELMPIAQFSGERNWGYDGVFPFAVQNSYGGPEGLKRFVDAAHRRGLAVVLDVVYNHLGPEGNVFGDYGPYFSECHRTPWGAPLNFDGPHSDEVRRYFLENALLWFHEFHVDALRLDAVHAIVDLSARPFLEELAEAVCRAADRLGRRLYLIAESALNDPRILRPAAQGGLGLDAQWNDDLHHALHALLTGERQGYYCDFGEFDQLLQALREGFVYDGRYSLFRKRRHGRSSRGLPPRRFVVYAQNHDQVGNRCRGERLSRLVSFEALKLALGIVLLSPNLPLLFMGEEYGELSPFPFFISHKDPVLIEAVRRGRQQEFASFAWEADPPDPQAETTFLSAKLNPDLARTEGPHRRLRDYCRRLIGLRRKLASFYKDHVPVEVFRLGSAPTGWIRRVRPTGDELLILFHTGKDSVAIDLPLAEGSWELLLESNHPRWGGDGGLGLETLQSLGDLRIDLPSFAFWVLFRRRGRRFPS